MNTVRWTAWFLLVVICVGGCSRAGPSSSSQVVKVTGDDSGSTVTLEPGQMFMVELSDVTPGKDRAWSLRSDEMAAAKIKAVAPETRWRQPKTGAFLFVFRAEEPGSATLGFAYRGPTEQVAIQTARYTVNVIAANGEGDSRHQAGR
jgi:predicted secreted protein